MKLSTDAELRLLQQEAFGYFLHETSPINGLVIDKTAPDWPASIAATGLGVGGLPGGSGARIHVARGCGGADAQDPTILLE